MSHQEEIVPISDVHWDIILKCYLHTYRGPNAVQDIKKQLEDYQVLRQSGQVERGRYVRYLPRGLVDVNLKRGGWVVKCNSASLRLQDGRRQWRVSRKDNFIFVRNRGGDGQDGGGSGDQDLGKGDDGGGNVNIHRKRIMRLLAEEALYQDDRIKKLVGDDEVDDVDTEQDGPRFRQICFRFNPD